MQHGGGALELACTESHGNVDVENARFSGVKVDSLG
jgi:hypothetical protein